MSMSFTTGSASRDTAAYGGFVDAIGGVATIVLAIIGLSGAKPEMLVAIATIVFGAALLVQGGAILSEYVGIIFPDGAGSMEEFGGSSVSALFMAGAAGIVLGILALVGVEFGDFDLDRDHRLRRRPPGKRQLCLSAAHVEAGGRAFVRCRLLAERRRRAGRA